MRASRARFSWGRRVLVVALSCGICSGVALGVGGGVQAAAAAVESRGLVGRVRVVGEGHDAAVQVVAGADVVRVKGVLSCELRRLQAATVEVLGRRAGDEFQLAGYRIIDVGGGQRPLVGRVVSLAGGALALQDGSGTPVGLRAAPRERRQLTALVGAKVWVVGATLLTGELKVARCGVLQEAACASVSDFVEKGGDACAVQCAQPSRG